MVEAVWWQPDTYVLSEHLIREPSIEDFSIAVSMALLVVLFLFLTRWHLLTRIKQISNSQIGQ
jgi:hypothetical protein